MTKAKLVIEINMAELAVRIAEANLQLKRPMANPLQVIEGMEEVEKDCGQCWLRGAKAAAEYLTELLNAAHPTS